MPRPKLSTLSIADLRQEIERRQKLFPKLIAQRDALTREIVGCAGSTRRRHRAKNKVGLADALAVFMKARRRSRSARRSNASRPVEG